MRSLGAVEANQETLCKDVAEIKKLLQEKAKEDKGEIRARTEIKTKSKILFAAIGTAFVAAISAATHYLIAKLCG
jgi:glucosamine 6-phosphate synthetase-like amidotransferase/phosphosugar isomerase protein